MLRRRANAFIFTLLILVGTVIAMDCLLLGFYFLLGLLFGFESREVSHFGMLFASFAAFIMLVALVIAVWQFGVCWRNALKGKDCCMACGYNMRGLAEETECPECGAPADQ